VVVFDLSAVTFMGSTGIGALVAVRNAGREAGVTVRIDSASEPAARVLGIAGLAAEFGMIKAD